MNCNCPNIGHCCDCNRCEHGRCKVCGSYRYPYTYVITQPLTWPQPTWTWTSPVITTTGGLTSGTFTQASGGIDGVCSSGAVCGPEGPR